MPMAMVCEACRKNAHQNCGNPAACVCAFRGHPQIPEVKFPIAGTNKWVTVDDDTADRSLQARYKSCRRTLRAAKAELLPDL